MDRSLLKAMTTMLVDLGRPVYAEDFEGPFLERTAEFYQVGQVSFALCCSCFFLEACRAL